MLLLFVHRLRHWIGRINLFESGSSEEATIRTQRWSSWIYVVLFLIILSILSVYTAMEDHITTVSIENPSYNVFQSLQQTYPLTLHCPCSVTSNQLSTFVQARVTFHQVMIVRFASNPRQQ